jgi:hypothetical protein
LKEQSVLVKVSGFQWYFHGVLNLERYMGHLSLISGVESLFDGFNRLIYVADHGSCWSGLIITIKDQKNFYRLKDRGGKVKISVGSVLDGEHMMEVNLFVVRKDTHRGLYLHYHDSMGLTIYQSYMRKFYSSWRAGVLQQAQHEHDKSLLRKVRKSPRALGWTLLTKPEGFRDLVAEFAKVKAFEYPATTFALEEPRYRPMQGYLKGETRTLRFTPGHPPLAVANKLMDFINENGIKRGTAHVQDVEGVDRIVRLLNNPQSFAEYDFDDIAPLLQDLDAEEYYNSELVDRLIKIVDENEVLLTFPER